MKIPDFDPVRLAALRAGLVERAAKAPRRGLPVWAGITTFAVAGALVGGAVSAAASRIIPTPLSSPQASPFTIGSAAGLRGVPALPGTQPGMPIVSLLGGGTSIQVVSSMTAPLTDIPATATDVRVDVTCVSAGRLAWGTNPTGNNPSATCAPTDVGTASASTFYDFSIKRADALYLDPTGEWIVSYQYLRKVETSWGVNSHGQTYGVEKDGAGSPDLVAVVGQAADGADVDGYAFAAALQWPGGREPTSPAEAQQQQDAIAKKYPNGIPVPVYKSDGTTRIGTFIVGGL